MSFKDKINNINVDEKGIVHDLISIKDSLLNSELLKEKKKKENYGIFMAILAHFILAINQLQLKTYSKWFKENTLKIIYYFIEASLHLLLVFI